MLALPAPLPTLPGATWRPLTLGDVAAYVRLQEQARVVDGGEEVMTEEIARRELDDPLCPTATNTLALALPDGSLGASIMAHERLQGLASRRVFLWGVTRPDLRGRGIGRIVLDWAAARGDEILADQPAHLERLVEAFKEERLAEAVALHESAGFQRARWYFDMRRDLREPIPGEPGLGGLRIDAYADAVEDIADLGERVRLVHNEAFADHWGSEPLTPEIWGRDFVGDPFFRADLSFVVLEGNEIAGYSVNYVIESDWEATGVREGWVGQLGVRRPWRGRGIATALLVRSMRAFRDAGLEAATLGVDVENPTGAIGIYERVGFRPIRRYVRLQRPYGGR
jgi:ribosomal protein S18 acetylase RimI-like enzyme